ELVTSCEWNLLSGGHRPPRVPDLLVFRIGALGDLRSFHVRIALLGTQTLDAIGRITPRGDYLGRIACMDAECCVAVVQERHSVRSRRGYADRDRSGLALVCLGAATGARTRQVGSANRER